MSSSHLPVLVAPDGFADLFHPLFAELGAGGVGAPYGVAPRAAGADAGDDVDVVVFVVAPIGAVVAAPVGAVVEVEAVAGAFALVRDVAPADVAVAAVAPAAAGAGSMTHKVRGEGWVQQASKASTVVGVAVCVVVAVGAGAAGTAGECETAWLESMSCASGRTVAADLAHGYVTGPGKGAATTAGESQIVHVATLLMEAVRRARNVAFDFAEVRRTTFVQGHAIETFAAAGWPDRKLVVAAVEEAEVILRLRLVSVPAVAWFDLPVDTAGPNSKVAEAEA